LSLLVIGSESQQSKYETKMTKNDSEANNNEWRRSQLTAKLMTMN